MRMTTWACISDLPGTRKHRGAAVGEGPLENSVAPGELARHGCEDWAWWLTRDAESRWCDTVCSCGTCFM